MRPGPAAAAAAAPAMSLQARDLAIGHDRQALGGGIALGLQTGGVFALLGPNGSGKTTLMRTLLGLLAPIAGTVELDGQPLAALSERARARALAWVPQQAPGAFDWPVRDLVMMGRSAHADLLAAPSRADHAAVDAALDRLGITALAGRPSSRLSGGERQLALIARALAQQARFVLLDEPTASLDLGNQARVLREIRRLADEDGLGVLFSTHDPNHALRIADQALLLREGRPLATGPAGTVIHTDHLQALYGVPVQAAHDPQGRRWFMAG
jgi:iron complex transport system ATP-binding protein